MWINLVTLNLAFTYYLKCFLNGPTSASFSFIFALFKQTIQFLQQINVKNSCPSSIWHRDSNPQHLEHESCPITTRPGLPVKWFYKTTFEKMLQRLPFSSSSASSLMKSFSFDYPASTAYISRSTTAALIRKDV